VSPNDRTASRARSPRRASAAAPRAEATAAGERTLAEARRAFDAAVKSAEAALEAILAEVAVLDERRAALLRDAEDLAARIASLDPQARIPPIPAGDAPRSRRRPPAAGGRARRRTAPARRAPASGGTDRVLELLRRRPLSLGDLRDELGVSATRVQQLMKPLREQGRVVSEPDPSSARPRQLWRATDGPA
jgi:hypothetical protein